MPTRVRVEDLGAKRAQQLAGKDRMKLRIGVLEAQAAEIHPSRPGVTVGEVAKWMEFGQPPHTPRRSWLFDWLDENVDKIVRQLGTDTMRVLFAKASEQQALSRRGTQYRQQIQGRINRRIPPPNRPGTLRRKQGDVPLKDTQVFYNAIRWEVVP